MGKGKPYSQLYNIIANYISDCQPQINYQPKMITNHRLSVNLRILLIWLPGHHPTSAQKFNQQRTRAVLSPPQTTVDILRFISFSLLHNLCCRSVDCN